MSKHDFSKHQAGDTIAEVHGAATPSTPVKVVKRTPKYLFLENGDKLHVEWGRSDKGHRYEPWSDEREAERAQHKRYRVLESRWREARCSINPLHASGAESVQLTDVLRDEATFAEMEALIAQFHKDCRVLVAKIVAGRPS